MKTFKNLISEVAEPKAGDEKAFKAKHIVTKVGHPVALDHQFTGEITGTKKSKRRADLAPGEDAEVYEDLDALNKKALKGKHKDRKDKDIDNDGDVDSSDEYLHRRRKAISKAINKDKTESTDESVEEILAENPMEEKPMMMGALRSMSHNLSGIARYIQSTQDPEEWFQNKLAGVAKEMQTLYSYATAEVMAMGEEAEIGEARSKAPKIKRSLADVSVKGIAKRANRMAATGKNEDIDEAKAKPVKQTISQKTITRALQGMKVQPKGKVSLKKAPWDKSESAEIVEADEGQIRIVDLAKVHPDNRAGATQKHGFQIQKFHGGKFVNQGAPYSTKDAADQVRETGQHSMQFESLDESFKAGMVKLKNGDSVVLKDKDAKILNQMFKDLTSANRKKMQATAMLDKSGFEEILGFAREAM